MFNFDNLRKKFTLAAVCLFLFSTSSFVMADELNPDRLAKIVLLAKLHIQDKAPSNNQESQFLLAATEAQQQCYDFCTEAWKHDLGALGEKCHEAVKNDSGLNNVNMQCLDDPSDMTHLERAQCTGGVMNLCMAEKRKCDESCTNMPN